MALYPAVGVHIFEFCQKEAGIINLQCLLLAHVSLKEI